MNILSRLAYFLYENEYLMKEKSKLLNAIRGPTSHFDDQQASYNNNKLARPYKSITAPISHNINTDSQQSRQVNCQKQKRYHLATCTLS